MKLRIRDNSVRVRLTQSEVARLAVGERIEQVTEFAGGARLISSVESAAKLSAGRAVYENNCVGVMLPAEMVKRWAESEEVSIEAEQRNEDGGCLKILIEKDFECLHSRAEGDSDAYPNPRQKGR